MKRSLMPLVLLILLHAAPLAAQESLEFPEIESLEELYNQIEVVAGGIEGNVGVYVLHVESGESVGINEDELYQIASVFKIPVLVTLFRLIDEGYFSLDDRIVLTEAMKTYGSGLLPAMRPGLNLSINDLQLLMMAVSDNTATDILFDLVGPDRIDAYMRELGLERTVIDLNTNQLILGYLGLDMYERLTIPQLWRVPAEYWASEERRERMARWDAEIHNMSTPREIGILLEKLVKGEIVDRETSDSIINTLRHHTGARLITRYLPFGISVARKGGSLGRDWRQTVLCDSGIIFLPDDAGHVVVCVFANDLRSEWYEFEIAVGQIARMAYDYFVDIHRHGE